MSHFVPTTFFLLTQAVLATCFCVHNTATTVTLGYVLGWGGVVGTPNVTCCFNWNPPCGNRTWLGDISHHVTDAGAAQLTCLFTSLLLLAT